MARLCSEKCFTLRTSQNCHIGRLWEVTTMIYNANVSVHDATRCKRVSPPYPVGHPRAFNLTGFAYAGFCCSDQ